MNGELWGLGRTWWMAIAIIVGSTVLTAMKVVTVDQWLEIIKWVFAAAAVKSGLQAIKK